MYSNFLKCFPFPLLLTASTIFPALLDLTSQKRHLKPIHRWCSGTNQSTAWIATWNQPARLPHIPCRPCKALGTSQTNLLCSRKKQQHEPSHPQWTCCSPQKRTVCVPPCIKSRQYPKHFPTSPLRQYYAGSLLLNFRGRLQRSKEIWCIQEDMAIGSTMEIAEAHRPGYLH